MVDASFDNNVQTTLCVFGRLSVWQIANEYQWSQMVDSDYNLSRPVDCQHFHQDLELDRTSSNYTIVLLHCPGKNKQISHIKQSGHSPQCPTTSLPEVPSP
jgi:hypothetical protein